MTVGWWSDDNSNENADNTKRSPSNDTQVAALVFPQVGSGVDGEEYKEYTSRSFTYHHASLAQVCSQWCLWYSWLITIMTLQVVDAAVRNAKASPTIEEVGGKLILTIAIRTLTSKSNALKSTSSDNPCKRALRLIIVNIFSGWEKRRRRRMWLRRAILTLREKLWSCDYHQNTTH